MFKSKKEIFIIILLVFTVLILNIELVEAANNTTQMSLKAPEFNNKIAVTISLIILVLILFILEPLPVGVIAILIPVILTVLKIGLKFLLRKHYQGLVIMRL